MDKTNEIYICLAGKPSFNPQKCMIHLLKDKLIMKHEYKHTPIFISIDISKLDIGDKVLVKDLNDSIRSSVRDDDSEVIIKCESLENKLPPITKELNQSHNNDETFNFPAEVL